MAFGKRRARRKAQPPVADLAQVKTIFDSMKKRWGAPDVELKFSASRLMIEPPSLQNPKGQEAAAWYNAADKTIEVSLPSLQDISTHYPGESSRYKGGLQDQMLVYVMGVLTHELSHGLQDVEERGMQQRHAEFGAPLQARPEGWPHDPRMQDRTHVLNKAELIPLRRKLQKSGLYEDDPMFQKAPELMPSFFGNQPYRRGFDPFTEPQLPGLPLSIGGRGGA